MKVNVYKYLTKVTTRRVNTLTVKVRMEVEVYKCLPIDGKSEGKHTGSGFEDRGERAKIPIDGESEEGEHAGGDGEDGGEGVDAAIEPAQDP
jgi:hypothetical protein